MHEHSSLYDDDDDHFRHSISIQIFIYTSQHLANSFNFTSNWIFLCIHTYVHLYALLKSNNINQGHKQNIDEKEARKTKSCASIIIWLLWRAGSIESEITFEKMIFFSLSVRHIIYYDFNQKMPIVNFIKFYSCFFGFFLCFSGLIIWKFLFNVHIIIFFC